MGSTKPQASTLPYKENPTALKLHLNSQPTCKGEGEIMNDLLDA